MMEAGLSLMQMAKTSAKLSLLAKAGLPYICISDGPNNRRRHGFLCHVG